jgi:5-(carboxyamino)imidazole ribonucleotide synthase|tara:strand:- start:395 stop:1441 length:1047 start_codon:yes stop_codon:yes gene_type:complete
MSKPTLGIIGGGQLGSMLAVAANKLDIKTVVFCDDVDAPAQNFSNEFIHGDYNDQNKIIEFASKVDVITYEFENIPYKTLNKINKIKTVLPKPSVNRIIQHRLAEKDFINNLNIRTTRYVSIKNKSEMNSVEDLLPGLLKTVTMGYDGKGQQPVKDLIEVDNLDIDYSKDYILEKLVKLKKEISIIITRFGHQKYEIYEPIENVHEDQILKHSKIPALISDKILYQSKEWASLIAEELKYVGTLCVEFFIDRNENLYVNEVAPRVHNSGHLTINAFNISQFENHVRAVCNLEQIHLKKISNAKMINIIGNQITVYRNKELNQNEFFFDYLKKDIKKKRKMGHLTTLVS